MSLKPASRAQLVGPACVLLLGLGGAVGCSAYPTFKNAPINCSVEDQYEFDPNPPSMTFSCYGDSTPDASAGVGAGDGVCGGPSAIVLRSSHNDDWGSTCNGSSLGSLDRSSYEGVSFWARAPDNSSKGFTLSLDDASTTDISEGGKCKKYNATDGGIGGSTINAAVDPTTGQVISGSAIASRLPDECGNNKGNSYTDVMAVTSEWALYTIPWGQFTQAAYPNRVPNPVLTETGKVPGTGLLTDQLFYLDIRPPKEVAFELWIDKLGFYRKRKPDAGQM